MHNRQAHAKAHYQLQCSFRAFQSGRVVRPYTCAPTLTELSTLAN